MNAEQINRLFQLFETVREETATNEELSELDQILARDKTACKYYIEYFNMCVLLRSGKAFDKRLATLPEMSDSLRDMDFWKEMAKEEKIAPGMEIPAVSKGFEEDEALREIVNVRPKISKFSIYSLILSSAAMIFIIVYGYFISMGQEIEVATLTSSMNARWADAHSSISQGTRFATSRDKFFLREGLADLRFDNEAVVTLEGPAEFQILTEDQIKLQYGRLYATVPRGAIGFTVNTPSARIIDLGTEFGIEAAAGGDTYLHVIDGKTTLIAGTKSKKLSMQVGKGIAKKISAASSVISNIPCNDKLFVRTFNTDQKLVWRGENLCLASIVAGYDGFREVDSLIGLDPVNGKYVTSIIQRWRRSNNTYNLITNLQFIDGVFIPDGESDPIQITSLDHTFNCPDTTGICTHDIAAYKGSIENQQTTIPPVILNGQEVVNEPILVLHSNMGITFDLQAIRKSLPKLDLKSLKATGVSNQSGSPNLDFWVLVNGQIKYERKIETMDSDRGPIPLNVEISPGDRFLTLIVTDGLRAKDDEKEYLFANDFFYLINPELCLTDNWEK